MSFICTYIYHLQCFLFFYVDSEFFQPEGLLWIFLVVLQFSLWLILSTFGCLKTSLFFLHSEKNILSIYNCGLIIFSLFSTGIPHFLVLRRYCIFLFFGFFFFNKLKMCGNPASRKSVDTIIPTEFAGFTSLCHILVILTIFKKFLIIICYGDLWSVIFDVTIVLVWGGHQPHPYKIANLIDKCVCSDWSPSQQFPHLSPAPPRTSLFPEAQQYWY